METLDGEEFIFNLEEIVLNVSLIPILTNANSIASTAEDYLVVSNIVKGRPRHLSDLYHGMES